MNHLNSSIDENLVEVRNGEAATSIVIVCEHASAFIPAEFGNLGLPVEALKSHVVWDPGAHGVAVAMAAHLDATLVASKTSRLVYDCNRPPEAPDAMPDRSEVYDIPGNAGLSDVQRAERVARFYEPFRAGVAGVMAAKVAPVLVTVHSFTPVYHGARRDVEIGVLHDADSRLADALIETAGGHLTRNVQRNAPYGPEDGVTHTLREHALPQGHLNVMLEVRNDLIADVPAEARMADALSGWVSAALARVEAAAC